MRISGIKVALVAALSAGMLASASAQTAASGQQSNSRVDGIIGKMSTEEKIDYIGGTGFAVRAMPKLGLPALEMSDGPAGVRSNAKFPSTTYAAGIGLAATFNPDLAQRVGDGIGKDARARGIHFMLGPGVNIYRAPMNGRNFEYFGEDPFLASAITVGYITGMQKNNVSSTVKHFLGNNSEFDRHNTDSIIDERTMREIYLPAFEGAVRKARVGAIMDSYNLLNGQHLTQDAHANIDIARKDWGFDGVIMSDWVATYDAVGAANGGLDLEMPTGEYMNQKNLLPAIKDGKVKIETIDEKVRRILNTANRFGWLDQPQTSTTLSKYNEQNHRVALDGAREGIVMLKNNGNILPLNRQAVKTVLVVGPDAYPAVPVAGGSGKSIPFTATSILQGISELVGNNVNVLYERGIPSFEEAVNQTEFMTAPQGGKRGVTVEQFESIDLSGSPKSTRVMSRINSKGTSWDDYADNWEELSASFQSNKPISRRWTGYYNAAEAGQFEVVAQYFGENSGYRLLIDDRKVLDNWEDARAQEDHKVVELTAGPHKVVVEDFQKFPIGGKIKVAITPQSKIVSAAAKAMAAKAEAVVLAVGFDPDSETEGADRTYALPFGQDELIRQITAANKKTIVAITSGGSVDTHGWIDQVPAMLELWYPGERGGTAVAEVLFGDVNPSGHLPITWEKKIEDNPSYANYYTMPGTRKIEYKEGIFVGYRGYDKNNVQPLFPFGYGLSYTSFKYGNLKVTSDSTANGPHYAVSFDVTNTGKVAGADVAQVYVGESKPKLPRPVKELKGFSKVMLKPGETKHVTVPLDARAFAYYDVDAKGWKINPGAFDVMVGRSSAELPLKQSVTIVESAVAQAKY